MDGYEDRENVLEAGGCRCDLDVQAYRVLSMLGEGCHDRCLQVLGKSVLSTLCLRCLLQAVLDILWLAVDEDGELRQRRGKLDFADVAYLRCLMRRYGWERSAGGVEGCSWSECFPFISLSEQEVRAICVDAGHPTTSSAQHTFVTSSARPSQPSAYARTACAQDP